MTDRRSAEGSRRHRGALENDVLAALAAGGAMTAAEVHAVVDPELAYTTVLTTMVRLHDKGALDRVRAGRAYVYTAITDPAQQSARAMSKAMHAAPDASAALAHFVDTLGPETVPVLQQLLTQAQRQRDGAAEQG